MPGNRNRNPMPRNGTRGRGPKPQRGRNRNVGRVVNRFNRSNGSGRNASQGQMSTNDDPRMIVRSKPLFSWRTRRTLQYYTTSSIITGTTTNNAYVFAANGLYDPDVTGTGGQPMGFDQMNLFYNHYTVLRCRITVLASNTSATLTPMFAVTVSGSSSVITSPEQLVEAGDVATNWLGFAGAKGSRATFKRSVNMAAFQGVDDIMDDPNMRGDAASNPTEMVYFHLNTWNPSSATQITTNFQVLMEFDTMFHEPRIPSLSLASLRLADSREVKEEKEVKVGAEVKACQFDTNKYDPPDICRSIRPGCDFIEVTTDPCFHAPGCMCKPTT